MNTIADDTQLRGQAWKAYFLAIAWPLYIFFLPYVYAQFGWLALLFIIFPGTYLFTWLACLMHECWHGYMPNLPNRTFYNIFSLMLFTDPQVFQLTHPWHHAKVHTYRDIEFHPLGKIENKSLRIIYNWLEIFVGSVFIYTVTNISLAQHPDFKDKYSYRQTILSTLVWITFVVSLAMASHLILGVTLSQIVISYAVGLWLESLMLHHNQLVEHGNLIVKGSLEERNLATRNLQPTSLLAKVFLFLTHRDSQEHVLHHNFSAINTRPFHDVAALPDGSVYITLKDYLIILRDMLLGRQIDYEKHATPETTKQPEASVA